MSIFSLRNPSGDDTPRPTPSPQNPPSPDPIRQLHELLLEVDASGISDGSDGKYAHQPGRHKDILWNVGWGDGRAGLRAGPREDIVASLARLEVAELRSTVSEGAEVAAASLSDLKERYASAREAADNAVKAKQEVLQERKKDPELFLPVMAVFFTLIAFFMAATDIPLTLNLAANSLGVEIGVKLEQKTAGNWQRCPASGCTAEQTLELKAGDLPIHPWLVLQYLWEPWLIAAGIAMMGLFMKLFLQEILFHQDGIPLPVRPWIRRTSYALMIIGVIGAYYYLGNVRAAAYTVPRASEALRKLPEVKLSDTQATKDKLTKQQQSYEKITQRGDDAAAYDAPWAFFLVTIMLPLISGVFLSEGIRCWTNTRKVIFTTADTAEAERIAQELQQQKFDLEKQVIGLKGRRLLVERQEFEDSFVRARQGIYAAGFERGARVPETMHTSASIIKLCNLKVRRDMARQLNRYQSAS